VFDQESPCPRCALGVLTPSTLSVYLRGPREAATRMKIGQCKLCRGVRLEERDVWLEAGELDRFPGTLAQKLAGWLHANPGR
jgi:hypothetical protein